MIVYYTAKFVGADGSMGLEHGKRYRLDIDSVGGLTALINNVQIVVHIIGVTSVPYKNISTFLNNWDEISDEIRSQIPGKI